MPPRRVREPTQQGRRAPLLDLRQVARAAEALQLAFGAGQPPDHQRGRVATPDSVSDHPGDQCGRRGIRGRSAARIGRGRCGQPDTGGQHTRALTVDQLAGRVGLPQQLVHLVPEVGEGGARLDDVLVHAGAATADQATEAAQLPERGTGGPDRFKDVGVAAGQVAARDQARAAGHGGKQHAVGLLGPLTWLGEPPDGHGERAREGGGLVVRPGQPKPRAGHPVRHPGRHDRVHPVEHLVHREQLDAGGPGRWPGAPGWPTAIADAATRQSMPCGSLTHSTADPCVPPRFPGSCRPRPLLGAGSYRHAQQVFDPPRRDQALVDRRVLDEHGGVVEHQEPAQVGMTVQMAEQRGRGLLCVVDRTGRTATGSRPSSIGPGVGDPLQLAQVRGDRRLPAR